MQSRPQFDLQAFDLVLKNCTKAIELDPKLGDAYVMRANVEDMFGMTQEAIKDYETAISINPTDLDAYNQLIIALGVQGNYEEALITANRYLTHAPNDYEMLSNRVKIYLGLNKMNEALNDLKTLQTIEPKNSFGFYLSGYLNDSIGKSEIACQEMLKADRLNSIQAHNFLYEKCPELMDPTSLKLEKLFYDALALEDQRKFKEAILKYDELIVLAPDSALFYYNRGKVKRTLELHKEAIVDYNSAIQLFPNEVTFWVSRAVSELYSRDTIASVNTLKKAIEINPSYPMSYFNLGSVLFEKKHYEEAIPFLELAIFYQSFYPKAYMCLGECYVQLKNYSRACEVYKRAEEIGINEAFAKRVKVCNFK
jgi:tetratricopeptide (TPR) repeat protein